MEHHEKAQIRQAFIQPEIVEQRSLFGNPMQGGGGLPGPTNFFPTGLPGGGLPGGGLPGGGLPGGGFPGGFPGGYPGGGFPGFGPPAQQAGSALGNLPLKDIKGFIDRMGGLDGILSTMTKMQRIFQNVQQMTPMLKLLMGSFLPKAKSADGDMKNVSPRKRRGKRSKGKGRSLARKQRSRKRR